MSHHGLLASQANRLEALRSRHAALSHRIESVMRHSSSDDEEIKELKRKKLYIKDEMSELQDELKDVARA